MPALHNCQRFHHPRIQRNIAEENKQKTINSKQTGIRCLKAAQDPRNLGSYLSSMSAIRPLLDSFLFLSDAALFAFCSTLSACFLAPRSIPKRYAILNSCFGSPHLPTLPEPVSSPPILFHGSAWCLLGTQTTSTTSLRRMYRNRNRKNTNEWAHVILFSCSQRSLEKNASV